MPPPEVERLKCIRESEKKREKKKREIDKKIRKRGKKEKKSKREKNKTEKKRKRKEETGRIVPSLRQEEPPEESKRPGDSSFLSQQAGRSSLEETTSLGNSIFLP